MSSISSLKSLKARTDRLGVVLPQDVSNAIDVALDLRAFTSFPTQSLDEAARTVIAAGFKSGSRKDLDAAFTKTVKTIASADVARTLGVRVIAEAEREAVQIALAHADEIIGAVRATETVAAAIAALNGASILPTTISAENVLAHSAAEVAAYKAAADGLEVLRGLLPSLGFLYPPAYVDASDIATCLKFVEVPAFADARSVHVFLDTLRGVKRVQASGFTHVDRFLPALVHAASTTPEPFAFATPGGFSGRVQDLDTARRRDWNAAAPALTA